MNSKVIDVHLHLGRWMFGEDCNDADTMREFMTAYNIEKGVISHSTGIYYDFVEGNSKLAAILKKNKSMWGYVVLNPHYLDESFGEIEKYSHNPKFVGFKLHPEAHNYRLNSKKALKLFEKLAELGLPILIHTFGPQISEVHKVAQLFPSLKIIMGHMGGDSWLQGIETAAKVDNLYLEPCCSFPDVDKIKDAFEAVGPDRLLFGSDYNMLNFGFVLGELMDARIPEAVLKKMFYTNAAQIFRFTN
jgi:predicted TIM-barrel fold metal-dependent hydrolase